MRDVVNLLALRRLLVPEKPYRPLGDRVADLVSCGRYSAMRTERDEALKAAAQRPLRHKQAEAEVEREFSEPRAGDHWRVKVDNIGPGDMIGASHSIQSHLDDPDRFASLSAENRRKIAETHALHGIITILPGTEFDELVIGHFCHVEQMGDGHYWASFAGVHINVYADPDGRARSVLVELAAPEPGCRYLGDIGEHDGEPDTTTEAR